MIRKALLLLLLLATPLLGDDAPYLVRDFPGSLTARGSLFTDSMWTTTGDTSWFVADRRDGFGRQVWKTDGTEEGTLQVTQIAGRGTGHADTFVGVVNGRLLYDGDTVEGGRLFAIDIDSGQWHTLMSDTTTQSGFGPGVMYKGELYFPAGAIPGNRTGTALGKSDGTPAGTSFLSLNSGLVDYSVGPRLAVVGNSILFTGHTAAGWGVFLTDGTMAGTTRLVAVRQNTFDLPTAVLGDKLLFLANPDPVTDTFTKQLWITDGTVEGSHLLVDKVDHFSVLSVLDGRLVIDLRKQGDTHTTWITDGTVAGTQPFDLVDTRWRYFPDRTIGGKYFFFADDSDTATFQDLALYTAGASPGTTVKVAGGLMGVSSSSAANGRFYFVASDEQHGAEWWSSDGTAAGTHIAADLYPGPRDGRGFGFALPRADGLLIGGQGREGFEPWLLDATGPTLLRNIALDVPSTSSNPQHLRVGRDLLFFTAVDGYDTVVGRSNGSAGGTRIAVVRPFHPWTPTQTVAAGNRYYIRSFSVSTGRSTLLSSEGTDAGTVVISEDAGEVFAFGDGVLFFEGSNNTIRFSDGTVPGTRFFAPATAGQLVLAANGVAWFVSGSTLAFTDGVAPVKFVTPTSPQIGLFLSAVPGPANTMYFIDNAAGGYRLWRTDGTSDGTRIVKVSDGLPGSPIAAADRLFFVVNGTLWVTDGTEANTVALPATGSACSDGKDVAVAGNQLFWYTRSEPGKQTLWQSDGTAAGTVNRLTYSTTAAPCTPVAAFEGRVYFSAFDTPHGTELWSSNGTAEGTGMVADLFPGVRGSEPQELIAGAGHLFFTADTPGKGRELWAIGDRDLPRRRGVRK
ncbi:MAG TPA: hypothetical protein VFV49_03075 [Thermoanaerobaculia bacterium]|nr:hypothetical protein [Thermoanaerobaculia bacterium]